MNGASKDPPAARLRVHTRLGHAVSVLLVFRGPCRALQDLCARDWSAIYRNRIPPYLTLPLAHLLLASPQPLQVTPSSSLPLSLHPPSFLLFSPFDSSLSPPFPSVFLSLTYSSSPSFSPNHFSRRFYPPVRDLNSFPLHRPTFFLLHAASLPRSCVASPSLFFLFSTDKRSWSSET